MKEEDLSYNYEEFVCLLLIYVSHIDLDYSQDEKERIKSLCSKLAYDKVKSKFDEMTDFAVLDTILKYKGLYYPTAERKQELLDNIEKQFNSDGHFSEMEKTMLLFLNKLM